MRLSDIMSRMDLTVWPEVALVIFLSVFAAVSVRVWRSTAGHEELARIPFEEDK